MLNFKRIGKVVALLLCCIISLACILPTSALSIAPVTGVSTTVAQNSALSVGELETETLDHLVSVVHYGASAGSRVIGCMENGTKVTVLGTKNGYYKIDCYDMKGYIAKSQVTVNEAGEYIVTAVAGSSESSTLPSYSAQEALQLRSAVVQISQKYIGVRYVYGGASPRGFDCSGLVQYVFRQAGVELGRSVTPQMTNSLIIAKEDLQPGDLIIFSNTGDGGFASHIGIYLGNGKLIHSGNSGVKIVELEDTYYAQHYQCARRVIIQDVAVAATLPTVSTITGTIGSSWRNDGN